MAKHVIKEVNIFNSIKGQMITDQTIIMENGIIIWKGPSSDYDSNTDDIILQGNNKYLLPGLIDTHVHLSTTSSFDRTAEYATTNQMSWGYISLINSQHHLKSGFTTLRDCGSDWDEGPALKKLINTKKIPGPRLLVANRRIMQWGNVDNSHKAEILKIDDYAKMQLSGKDAIIQAVRQRKYSGSDFIKTATTGGITHGVDSKIDFTLFTDDEINELVQESHRLGMSVACHAHGDEGIQKAVKAGIDTLEHWVIYF